jgi:hypothetical protein
MTFFIDMGQINHPLAHEMSYKLNDVITMRSSYERYGTAAPH